MKLPVEIEPTKGQITIGNLYENKESLVGKKVLVKGKVAKFSAEIMGKNWIHIQDGTESNGKYDLTVTTALTAAVGDIVILKGKIALNKDFGFSYFYEVLMEDAKIIK